MEKAIDIEKAKYSTWEIRKKINNWEFVANVPFETTKFFSEYINSLVSARKLTDNNQGPDKKIPEVLEDLKDKFDFAVKYSSKFLGFQRKTQVDLNYAQLDFLGASKLSEVIRSVSGSKDKKLKDGKPAFANTEIDKIGLNIINRKASERNVNGITKTNLAEFGSNFLALNSAFVKAGGRDNLGLKEVYKQIVNNNKK